jgi:hypothetical protein
MLVTKVDDVASYYRSGALVDYVEVVGSKEVECSAVWLWWLVCLV